MPKKTYEGASFNQMRALERFYPSRAHDAPLTSEQQASQGICLALSLSWLSRVVFSRDESSEERIQFVESEKNIVDCVQSQMYYQLELHIEKKYESYFGQFEKWRSQSKLRSINRLLRTAEIFNFSKYDLMFNARIPLNFFLSSRIISDLENRASAVTSRIAVLNTSHILAVTYTKSDGSSNAHAMACHMSPGILLYFDPNTGEIRIPESDIHEFLIEALGYFNKKYTLTTIEVARIA